MSSTVKDIAQLAQVSAATVSLVLNGKGGISEETRARVLQAAASLHYAPRSPKAGAPAHTGTLRFLKIAKHGHTVNRDHNTFIADYIDGMSHEAGAKGYKLEIVSYEGTPVEDIVASLAGTSLSGVVVLGTELSEDDVRLFEGVALPLVFIDTHYDLLEQNFVNMNNRDAVFKILSHFAQRGFRHIGFVASNVATTNFRLRREAFMDGMKVLGLPVRSRDIITVDSTYDGAYQDMLAKLQGGLAVPECLFCTNDIITYGCIKALREFNLRIPQDLSVIGFDNLPMSAAMDPPLTTIDVSKRQIGYQAIKLLDDLVRATDRAPAVKIMVGANLVERASVASPPQR
ncbi:LacI family DNA-binding transcriptional regulator [uncultured Aquincola sp.]|uniref:LacI family DNA-binding transcriptional regulator n=1 Tax=uncultured Aquincola sp. TaxID=886556 RepID=UPI0032B2E284|tara:strand:+ start:2686 stop:3717 length:1032 start_codon:yes stop_codon:yes gene_type:complete